MIPGLGAGDAVCVMIVGVALTVPVVGVGAGDAFDGDADAGALGVVPAVAPDVPHALNTIASAARATNDLFTTPAYSALKAEGSGVRCGDG